MTHSNVKARLLPFSVIQKAAGGDVEAINAVLKHYEGYNSQTVAARAVRRIRQPSFMCGRRTAP